MRVFCSRLIHRCEIKGPLFQIFILRQTIILISTIADNFTIGVAMHSLSSGSLSFSDAVRVVLSLIGIVYVWTLPFNPIAEADGTSVSQFIANPPATGLMAAVSIIPCSLM